MARARARGELIERVSAVWRVGEPVLRAPASALGASAVPPGLLAPFSARQRARRSATRSPLLRIPPACDPRVAIDWTPACSLRTGVVRYLPSAAVYFRYPGRRYCAADSNGLAAGRTFAEAALRALLELVERDSVALWWYNRVRRPALRLRPGLRDRELAALAGLFARLEREVWLLDLESDLGIPVLAAVSRRVGSPGEDLALGFGSAPSRGRAARHALRELGQALALRAVGGRGGAGTARFEQWRRTATVGGSPWLAPAGYVRGGRALPSGPPGRALTAVVRRLAARGLDPLVVELSRPGAGLRVVRAVVPGLCHLWPRLGAERLYHGPLAAGWRATPLAEAQLNRVPLLV
jgi:ribosomal protein S12 methylthiotransferase accessory factor